MRIAKSRVVNLFILLGCPKAVKWNNEVLAGRVATLHELFDPAMEIDNNYRALFEKVYNASKNNIAIDIIDDTNNPVVAIIRNTDAVTLKMKPIEEPPEGETIKPPKSESEVTIVPDVDELDNVEENDDFEALKETTESEIIEAEIVEAETRVKDEPKITESKITEPEIIEAEIVEAKTVETKTSKKPKRVKAAPIKSVQQSDTETSQSGTEQSVNLPVYKSKLGKPQQVRRPLFNFEMLDIPIGAKLYFANDMSKCATVCGKKTVKFEEIFNDEPVSLTNLTKTLLNLPRDVQPTGYWLYEGVTLKKLYYDKFSDFENDTNKDNTKKIKYGATVKQFPQRILKTTYWDVFKWDMNEDAMNPVEHCFVSRDSLTIDEISTLTNLSTAKVKQLLFPLVRYGLLLQNDNGTFTRKIEQSTQVE
ncbi:MAG: hypothetical protein LBP87_05670 [Planctomycetaceae bacterium]|jgi:hypothetical protein|nr:hypothetical protein [Planctomycetaceae bacterium]